MKIIFVVAVISLLGAAGFYFYVAEQFRPSQVGVLDTWKLRTQLAPKVDLPVEKVG